MRSRFFSFFLPFLRPGYKFLLDGVNWCRSLFDKNGWASQILFGLSVFYLQIRKPENETFPPVANARNLFKGSFRFLLLPWHSSKMVCFPGLPLAIHAAAKYSFWGKLCRPTSFVALLLTVPSHAFHQSWCWWMCLLFFMFSGILLLLNVIVK